MKKEDKKVAKEKKFKFSEIFTNKRCYAVANLLFYSVIILVLIASVRNNPSTESNNATVGNDAVSKVTVEGFESIKNRNFNFKYTINSKDKEIVYEGKQREDKILFVNQIDKKEYFKQKNLILEKKSEGYVLNSDFESYFDFFDVELIVTILQSSYFEDGEYFISNKDFANVVGFPENDDELYGVYIELNRQNGIITSIQFDFSEISHDVQTIVLEYLNYGLIEDFDIK